MPVSQPGQAKRAWYHEDSMKVSKVSVSRRAGSPVSGSVVSTNSGRVASGDPPPDTFTSSGSTTGSCASGTGSSPRVSLVMTGTGQPQ